MAEYHHAIQKAPSKSVLLQRTVQKAESSVLIQMQTRCMLDIEKVR